MVAAGLAMWYVGEDGGSLPGQEDEATAVVKTDASIAGRTSMPPTTMGETPLHGAAFRGVNAIAEYLVEKGARLDAKDNRGWTPLFVANGLSHGDVFKAQPQTAELLTSADEGARSLHRGPVGRRHGVPRLHADASRSGESGARSRCPDGG